VADLRDSQARKVEAESVRTMCTAIEQAFRKFQVAANEFAAALAQPTDQRSPEAMHVAAVVRQCVLGAEGLLGPTLLDLRAYAGSLSHGADARVRGNGLKPPAEPLPMPPIEGKLTGVYHSLIGRT